MKNYIVLFLTSFFLLSSCGKSEPNENIVPTETPPSIISMTATCFYGSTVVITGANFSSNPTDNTVKFGNIEATVIGATNTSLTVTTPHLGDATATDVTVTTFDMISNVGNIAVDVDQNKVATYEWITHTVKPGVIYKTGQFDLFGSTERRIHVLGVTLNEANTLGIGYSEPKKSTVVICENDYGAVAGINAGYFKMGASDNSNKDPYIRIGGVTIQEGHQNTPQLFTNAALLIHNNAVTVQKFSGSGTNLNRAAAAIPPSQAEDIIVCGPMLITAGAVEDLKMTNEPHNTSSTGRTALGISEDGKRVIIAVVDYGNITGVDMVQLAKIMQALGAFNAMSFDGGGSSTMFVKGQGAGGRVSINGNSMRAVNSVIYVK